MRFIAGTVGLLVRLVLLPFKVVLALTGIGFKVGMRVSTAPMRIGWRATRAAGFSGVGCFVLGLLLGLLVAPFPGKDLRAVIKLKLAEMRGGDAEQVVDQPVATIDPEVEAALEEVSPS